MKVVSIKERWDAATAAKRAAIDAACAELVACAKDLDGRFVVFGSTARGEADYDSDLDLLLDFPAGTPTDVALDLAERICARYDLACDAVPIAQCSAEFLSHVGKDARLLS